MPKKNVKSRKTHKTLPKQKKGKNKTSIFSNQLLVKGRILLLLLIIITATVLFFQTEEEVTEKNICEEGEACGNNIVHNNIQDEWNLEEITRINNKPPYFSSGGPAKDGIPSIDSPQFTTTDKTLFDDDELIIGISHNGETKAYPYAILNWHEIVNDEIGGVPVAVTYCPLCETNSVFVREIDGQETTFGVSGLLWNSCLVMYDRATESLWIQPWGVSVQGEKEHEQLQRLVAHRTTLGAWKKAYPDTQVLSTETGYTRNYEHYPYGDYYTNNELIFPVENQTSLTGHPKEIMQVFFVDETQKPFNTYGGDTYTLKHAEVKAEKEQRFKVGNQTITAEWDEGLNTIRFYDKAKKELPSMAAFGFVAEVFFK